MYDIVTIVGNVATDPTQGRTASGVSVTNFRLASTHRRFDDATQTWVDIVTNWYSVAAFRELGEHAKASLRSGDRVIVTGKMMIRQWENSGKNGTSVDIDANAIGHDLRWGTAVFSRSSRSTSDPATRGDEQRHTAVDESLMHREEDGPTTESSWSQPFASQGMTAHG